MFITDTYGTGTDVNTLYCELSSIIMRHRNELHACNISKDIETLKWAIEKSLSGSAAATYFLMHHGARILTLIREKIFLYQNSTSVTA